MQHFLSSCCLGQSWSCWPRFDSRVVGFVLRFCHRAQPPTIFFKCVTWQPLQRNSQYTSIHRILIMLAAHKMAFLPTLSFPYRFCLLYRAVSASIVTEQLFRTVSRRTLPVSHTHNLLMTRSTSDLTAIIYPSPISVALKG